MRREQIVRVEQGEGFAHERIDPDDQSVEETLDRYNLIDIGVLVKRELEQRTEKEQN